MKKNKLSVLALSGLMVLGSFSAIAADENTAAETPVEFELKKGSVIDPEITDPEITDPNPGGDTDFRIWYVPTEFVFNAGKITSLASTHTLKGPQNRKVAVADIRDSRSGWTLSANLTDFVNTTTTKAIDGATISWNQSIGEIEDPTQIDLMGASDVTGPTSLTVGKESVTVMQANENKGFGYTNATLSDIKLNLLAKTGEVGIYEGSVQWTLTQRPAVGE